VWVLGIQIGIMAVLGALALDLYAHKRWEGFGGVNMRGYRGPVARAKRSREIRVALVGGARAYGWGMVASATTAPDMFTRMMLVIDRPGTDPPPLVVVNLGRLGAGVSDYPHTIEHYANLQLDYICLYDDLGVRDTVPTWADSGVFALTGYMPLLPLVLREKGLSLRFGSAILGYGGGAHAPNQSSVRRAAGLALEGAGASLMSIDQALGRRSRWREQTPAAAPAPYADLLQTAIDVAHRHARGVVVVISPAEVDEQRRNLRTLESLRRRCVESAWCRFVDLGRVPEAWDPTLRVDTWNYGGEGTWAVAEAITPAVLDLMGYH
jgi:hypothetical protein